MDRIKYRRHKDYLISIIDLVRNGELRGACDKLAGYLEGKSRRYYNEIIVHCAKLKQLQRDERMGLVSPTEAQQTRSQVTFGVLELIAELRKGVLVQNESSRTKDIADNQGETDDIESNRKQEQLIERFENPNKYDVALSFAGEDRKYAEEIAKLLAEKGIRTFYDQFEQAHLWGKDLYEHLQSVYRDNARYCVIILSRFYAQKLWTRHELKQAQTRAFLENKEYILPLRLDDTIIPGINETVSYIDMRNTSIMEIVKLLVTKLSNGSE